MIENIRVVKTIDVPTDRVWAAVRSIGGLDRWFPVIATCRVEGEGLGAVRILGLRDGGEMKDVIEEINDPARRFRYLRTDHPFPVTPYRGTVLVRDGGNGNTEVTWDVEIDVAQEARDDLVAFIGSALADGISGLAADLRTEGRAA